MKTLATTLSLALSLTTACLATAAHAQGYYAQTQATARVTGSQAAGYPQLGNWAATVSDGNYVGSGAFNRSASATNAGGSLNGKSTTASGSADLRTGKLGVLAAVSNQVSAPSSVTSILAMGVAEFGDSYRFASPDGQPYSWTSASAVSFDFHVDGVLANTSGSVNAVSVQFDLQLFAPGSIGNQYNSSARLGAVTWLASVAGDGTVFLYADTQDPANPIQLTATQTGSFTGGGYDLHATFNPGGNFDWRASLLVSTYLSTATGMASADLSHTATGGFTGPEAALATASSGYLLATPVPEPASHALWALGLALVALLKRRRRA